MNGSDARADPPDPRSPGGTPPAGTGPGGTPPAGTSPARNKRRPHAGRRAEPLQVVIVTGLSGAGRGTAARCLEDLGWYVVDNLPPALLPTLVDLGRRSQGAVNRIAAVVDVRGGAFFSDLREALETIARSGVRPRVLFLEAQDSELIRRFEAVRRPHPLQGADRLVDGIARERESMRELRGEAELTVDTTSLNVHELRSAIQAAFDAPTGSALQVSVLSFGYKHGLPVDADLVVDCRFLPNPHWVPELAPLSGLDPRVSSWVLGQPGARELLSRFQSLVALVVGGYEREGRHHLTVAVGCTGGRHRSVALAAQLAEELKAAGVPARASHRDLERP